jgi:hypothetical protein
MHKRRSALALILAVAIGLVAGQVLAADPGVTATEIKLGNTNPYSGPASAYGTIGKSIGAYFKKINEEGGINGRKLNFVTLDDATARLRPSDGQKLRRTTRCSSSRPSARRRTAPSGTHERRAGATAFVATGAVGRPRAIRGPWVGSPRTRPRATSTPVRAQNAGSENRDPLPERRLREGLPRGFKDGLGPAAKAIALESSPTR